MILKKKNGLTLLECVVAMVLLAVTLSAGMGFYFYSSGVMGMAMRKKIAMEMVSQYLEDKRANPPLVTVISSGTCFFTGLLATLCTPSAAAWDISMFPNSPGGVPIQGSFRINPLTAVSPSLRQLEFSVTWWEPQLNAPLTTSASTMLLST